VRVWKTCWSQTDADNDASERDTMDQRIGPIDEVIAVVTELVDGSIDWQEACRRLPAYDGVQAVD
jgi:glycyl-tRNA synthetase